MRSVQLFVFACLVPMLFGCSTVPIQDDVTRKETFQIVQQIRCEARKAVFQYRDNLPNAAIAYEFTFSITEGNNATTSATAGVPFLAGSFSLMGSAGINDTRETNRNFTTVDTFTDLMNLKNCSRDELARDFIYPISGDIGMEEVVGTFIKLSQIDDAAATAAVPPSPNGPAPSGTTAGTTDVFTFADTLMFTTTLMAGLTPTLTLNPISRQFRISNATAGLAAGRTDIHTVVVALAAMPQSKTAAPKQTAATAKVARPRLGSSINFTSAVGSTNSSSVLTTTALKLRATDPRDRALIELDRQRILALQARTPNLLVGP
jgi:hypothetical protein